MSHAIMPAMVTKKSAKPAEEPKRRGRPPGTGLPPELVKNEMIRVRCTKAELDKFEAIGGAETFRKWLHRARIPS